MKPKYALLEIGAGTASDTSIAGTTALRELKADSIERYQMAAGKALPDLGSCNLAVIYGNCEGVDLLELCQNAKKAGVWPIVAVDAISSSSDLSGTFSKLEMELVQLAKVAGLLATIKSGRTFTYGYEKTDCSATACLLFDGGTQALVIERLHDPYAGRNAFPGGFLRVLLETLEDCAYRELEEECGIKLVQGELMLVDLRSTVDRDPRAHIVDAGYAALISHRRKPEILAQLKAGDDAGKAHLMPVAELLRPDALAFDHGDFLVNVLKHFNLVKYTRFV